MQMKYLSLALAAALATTLTACGGSDNKSNYNKDTLTPVTKPDVKPGDGGDTKPGDTKPGGNENKGDEKPEDETKKPEDENKKPETPKGSDIKNNVGDAANPGNLTKDNVVVAQNYLRGNASQFDKSNNKDQVGNATVLGFNQLNNTYMSNVVVSRVPIEGEKDRYTTLYLGQTPADAGKNLWSKETAQIGAPDQALITSTGQVNGLGYRVELEELNGVAGKYVGGKSKTDVAGSLKDDKLGNKASSGDTSLQKNNITDINASNRLFRNLDLNAVGQEAYTSGIVTVKSGGLSYKQDTAQTEGTNLENSEFAVRGQEDQIWRLDGNNNVDIIHATGDTGSDTRIFGSLSHQDDVPSHIWNGKKFIENPYYHLWQDVKVGDLSVAPIDRSWFTAATDNEDIRNSAVDATYNAYTNQAEAFDTFKNSYLLTSDIVDARIAGLKAAKILDGTGTKPFYDGNPTNVNDVLVSKVLNPVKQHLNFAQYGRVTAETKDLTGIIDAVSQKKPYYQFLGGSKYQLQNAKPLASQAPNTKVDFYYARGLQPTTNMPKSGKYVYLGHALTYGLDNSFHGGVDNLDSNALIDISRSGTGNYVAAELDAADKSVKGKIYNVWTVENKNIEAGATEDVLVNFAGKLNDTTNSVIGEAYRPYVAKDTKATFKGAFFGPNAEEFAGNINTVEEGYGNPKWGAVFGAQRPKESVTINFENAVEKEQN